MVTDLKGMLNTWYPLRDEQQWVLATLYQIEGSSYRKLGAMMLISSLGQRLGMLSGGCLEADIQRHAKQVMTSLHSKTITYDATDEDDLTFQLGIGCGGVVHIILQSVNSENEYLQLDSMFNALKNKQSGHYTQQIKPLVAKGSGVFKTVAQQHNLSLNRKATLLEQDKVQRLEVAIYPSAHLLIVGGGADAIPVYAFAKQLGWMVSVWDSRAANAKRDYFKLADNILRCPATQLKQFCEQHKVDAAVLMAHSVELDSQALAALEQSQLKYMGLLGPTHRRAQVFEHANTTVNKVVAPVFGPVGLNLGGDSPESIALSLISEIHAVFANKDATSLSNWGN